MDSSDVTTSEAPTESTERVPILNIVLVAVCCPVTVAIIMAPVLWRLHVAWEPRRIRPVASGLPDVVTLPLPMVSYKRCRKNRQPVESAPGSVASNDDVSCSSCKDFADAVADVAAVVAADAAAAVVAAATAAGDDDDGGRGGEEATDMPVNVVIAADVAVDGDGGEEATDKPAEVAAIAAGDGGGGGEEATDKPADVAAIAAGDGGGGEEATDKPADVAAIAAGVDNGAEEVMET